MPLGPSPENFSSSTLSSVINALEILQKMVLKLLMGNDDLLRYVLEERVELAFSVVRQPNDLLNVLNVPHTKFIRVWDLYIIVLRLAVAPSSPSQICAQAL